jgi:hypothetical protein
MTSPARRYGLFRFSRALLYQLIYNNKLSSIVIKTDRRNARGIRLISRAALDEFIRTAGES